MRLWIIRICVSFLLAMGLVAGSIGFMSRVLGVGPVVETWQRKTVSEMRVYGGTLADLLEAGDSRAANILLQRLQKEKGVRAVLFDQDYLLLAEGPVGLPRVASESTPELRSGSDSELQGYAMQIAGGGELFTQGVTLPYGNSDATGYLGVRFTDSLGQTRYLVYEADPSKFFPVPSSHWQFWVRGGGPLFGLLLCLFFLRISSRYTNAFRTAFKQMAEGKLSVRVNPDIDVHGGSYGEIAREFNSMVESMERVHVAQHELIGNISHEMRSPLSRMSLALEMAEASEQDGMTGRMLEQIKKDAGRLSYLSSQMLTLARCSNGESQKVELDLGDIVRTVAESCSLEARGMNRRIILQDDSRRMPVAGDREQLVSMVENVVRNALRHTPEDTAVTVSLEHALEAESEAAFVTVRDRGEGVPEGQEKRIFDPYHKAKNSAAGGTGLGLAITSAVAVSHGGAVEARNMTDGGLRVTMRIPLMAKGEVVQAPAMLQFAHQG